MGSLSRFLHSKDVYSTGRYNHFKLQASYYHRAIKRLSLWTHNWITDNIRFFTHFLASNKVWKINFCQIYFCNCLIFLLALSSYLSPPTKEATFVRSWHEIWVGKFYFKRESKLGFYLLKLSDTKNHGIKLEVTSRIIARPGSRRKNPLYQTKEKKYSIFLINFPFSSQFSSSLSASLFMFLSFFFFSSFPFLLICHIVVGDPFFFKVPLKIIKVNLIIFVR